MDTDHGMDTDQGVVVVKRIGHLEDCLLEHVINKLTATEQVAITRVCKKFDSLALKVTNVLDVGKIPNENVLQLVRKMPKLKSIIGLGPDISVELVKGIASLNKNIVHFSGSRSYVHHMYIYYQVGVYISAVKECDENYTGSILTNVFTYEKYKELMEKFPDLRIRCHLYLAEDFFDYLDVQKNNVHDVNRATTALTIRDIEVPRVISVLTKTVNVTDLDIKIIPECKSFRFYEVFDAISGLNSLRSLKLIHLFELEENGSVEQLNNPDDNMYRMTETDFNSLSKVLSIKSLRLVEFYLGCHPDHENMYNCFMRSANNNYNSIDIFFRSSFILTYPLTGYDDWNGRTTLKKPFTHGVEVGLLDNLIVTDFIKKFKRHPGRRFNFLCKNDNDWNQIKRSCEQFAESNHAYQFTLGRLICDHLFDNPEEDEVGETIHYNFF